MVFPDSLNVNLPFVLVLLIGPEVLLGYRGDCSHTTVVNNFMRMCKAYPNLKRSTPDLSQGGYWNRDYNNGIRGWPGLSPDQAVRYPSGPQNGMYPGDSDKSMGGGLEEEYPLEWLFNPVDYGGENQLPLERWRRDRHFQEEYLRFTDNCCSNGCTFPQDYMAFDRKTNFCNFR